MKLLAVLILEGAQAFHSWSNQVFSKIDWDSSAVSFLCIPFRADIFSFLQDQKAMRSSGDNCSTRNNRLISKLVGSRPRKASVSSGQTTEVKTTSEKEVKPGGDSTMQAQGQGSRVKEQSLISILWLKRLSFSEHWNGLLLKRLKEMCSPSQASEARNWKMKASSLGSPLLVPGSSDPWSLIRLNSTAQVTAFST